MAKKKDTVKDLAEIIRSQLHFTNGWYIDDESYDQHCEKAAKRIIYLLKRRKILNDTSSV